MIKTALFFIYVAGIAICVIPIAVVAMLLSFIGLGKPMRTLVYSIARLWALGLIKIIGCPVTVKGRETIPKEGGVCFVSNHGGLFDIAMLFAYCGRPIGFVAKKELLYIPFLNIWVFLIGGLFIDRGNIRKALRTIDKGIARIKAGGGMIIFPEGHRSRGEGLLPFHPGSLKLATQAGAPIVPVSIYGSYELFERQNRVISVPVGISFSEPIETANLPVTDRKIVLSEKIHAIIKEQLEIIKENVS